MQLLYRISLVRLQHHSRLKHSCLQQPPVYRAAVQILHAPGVGRGQEANAAVTALLHGGAVLQGGDFIHGNPLGPHRPEQQLHAFCFTGSRQHVGAAAGLELVALVQGRKQLPPLVRNGHCLPFAIGDLADQVPFRELFQPCYLGILGEEDVNEASTTRCSMDVEIALRGGCRAKIHAGPGMVKRGGQEDKEVRFILDNDLFMSGNVPINLSAGAMQTLHQQAGSLFLGAVTQRLYDALEPLELL